MWDSQETRSPTLRSVTFRPMATMSPAVSWPGVTGGAVWSLDQSSQSMMWISVPHSAVQRTRMSTSSSPISGMGRSS